MKIVAAALIILSGMGLGYSMAEVFRRRPLQIRQLQFALTVLSSEIRFRQAPLPISLNNVAAAVTGPVGQLFSDLASVLEWADGRAVGWAWHQVVPGRGVALAQEDLDVLDSLMQVLGGGNVNEQCRQLDLHLEHLRNMEVEAQRARRANEKIWRYLGVFAGLALVLILL